MTAYFPNSAFNNAGHKEDFFSLLSVYLHYENHQMKNMGDLSHYPATEHFQAHYCKKVAVSPK